MTPREVIDFLNIVSVLKTNTRHCYTQLDRKESVADHIWRTALIPMLIENDFPDIDMNKVIRMILIHDLGEAVTGDIPVFVKTESNEATEELAIKSLLENLPDDIKSNFQELFKEMSAMQTKEAKLYKALDNMEAVIAHNESPLSTWLPLEYELNLNYGKDKVEFSTWLQELKEECNKDTRKKIEKGV